MPKIVKPFTELEIKRAKPKAKDYTKPDGKGLQLCIKANGREIWEFIFLSPTKHKRRKATFKTYLPNLAVRLTTSGKLENLYVPNKEIQAVLNHLTRLKRLVR